MYKPFIFAILLIPLLARAQPPGMGGGFQGGPPEGGPPDPEATMEALLNKAGHTCEKVDYAADLLYPAAEEFFALVNEVDALPPLSSKWDEVNAALADAYSDEELNVAEGNFRVYTVEVKDCRAALDELWKNKKRRKGVIEALAGSRDGLLLVQDDVEAAVEISKGAKDDLKDIEKRLKEMRDMGSRMPNPPGAPGGAAPAGAPLSIEMEAVVTAKNRAEEQMEFGRNILKKLGKML